MATNEGARTLSTRQQKAIAALLAAKSQEQAAHIAGVSETTITRWIRDPAFTAALREAEGDLIDQVTRKLIGVADGALGHVVAILKDPSSSPNVQLRAATILLDNLLRLRELRNIEERLATLEERLSNEHN